MRFFARYWAVILSSVLTLRAMAQIVNPPPVIDAWYSWLLVWAFRPGIAAVVVGILFSFVVTQRVKMDFPHTWTADRRRRTTRRVSFICGFIPCMLLWPLGWMSTGMTATDIYLVWVTGLLAAVAVGAAAPFSYTVIMNFLYKHHWAKAENWSGEETAKMKRIDDPTVALQPQDVTPNQGN